MTDHDAPSGGGRPEPIVRQALLRWLSRAPEDDRAAVTWLDKIICAHLDKAVAGDLAAIKELYERADGKPASGAAGGEPRPASRIVKWMD